MRPLERSIPENSVVVGAPSTQKERPHDRTRVLRHAPPRRRAVVSAALLVAAGLLVAAPVMAHSRYYNFESGQVRPLVLSPSRALVFAANTRSS